MSKDFKESQDSQPSMKACWDGVKKRVGHCWNCDKDEMLVGDAGLEGELCKKCFEQYVSWLQEGNSFGVD